MRLQGTIVAFDQEAIFLMPPGSEDDADVMMVYKVQIASVSPDSAKKAWRSRSATMGESPGAHIVGERRVGHAQ